MYCIILTRISSDAFFVVSQLRFGTLVNKRILMMMMAPISEVHVYSRLSVSYERQHSAAVAGIWKTSVTCRVASVG